MSAHDPFYNLNRWKLARAAAKQRDGYQCTHCGRTGVPLDVDHILGWRQRPDLAFELDNLRSLCRRCHNQRTHGKPKRRNSKRASSRSGARGQAEATQLEAMVTIRVFLTARNSTDVSAGVFLCGRSGSRDEMG